ncbi:MAG: hypothetical protein D6785_08475, partial [Planctomycetota bacterium]
GENFAIIYGSSASGVDLYIEELWKKEGKVWPLIGITCEEYKKYVPDEKDRPPVVIAKNPEEYGKWFTEILDILFITGGREHAYDHDAKAVELGKTVVIYNCAPEIPAKNAEGKIENAASFLSEEFQEKRFPGVNVSGKVLLVKEGEEEEIQKLLE